MGLRDFFGGGDEDLEEYNEAKKKIKEFEVIEKLAKKLRETDKEVIDFSLMKAKRMLKEEEEKEEEAKRRKQDEDNDENEEDNELI